jgi:cytochrome c oxidase subunit IV
MTDTLETPSSQDEHAADEHHGIGPLFLPVLLGLMVVKFFTVVLYFMHIKFDNNVFGRLFYIGLGLAVFVYAAALSTFQFFAG